MKNPLFLFYQNRFRLLHSTSFSLFSSIIEKIVSRMRQFYIPKQAIPFRHIPSSLFRISSKICKFPIEGISFRLALSKRNKMKKLYDTVMGNLGKGLTLRMKHKENP